MKAKEYFEKYFENVKNFEEISENGNAMFKDMLKEFDEIKRREIPKRLMGLSELCENSMTKGTPLRQRSHRNSPRLLSSATSFGIYFYRKNGKRNFHENPIERR